MTATTKTTKTESNNDVVDVAANPVDNVAPVESSNKDETNESSNEDSETKDETNESSNEDSTTTPTVVPDDDKAIVADARRLDARHQQGTNYFGALEDTGHYTDLGCFYASGTPVPGAVGAELGVVTKDEKTGAIQRTGLGLYIRSDHAANASYRCVL